MSKHLKRLAIPNSWTLAKKESKYVTRPHPTRSFDMSMPINLVLRDLLKIAKTTKEVKGILGHSYVFVNGKRATDEKQVMGFMDIFEIKGSEQSYRMLLDAKGKLYLHAIKGDETKFRPVKIIGKTLLKGAKMQLNLSDGYNLLVEKGDFKVGDSVLLETPGNKIREVIALKKGAAVCMTAGSHIGKVGNVLELEDGKITFKSGNETLKTATRYAFAVGNEKPMITFDHK